MLTKEERRVAAELFANDIQAFAEYFFPHIMTYSTPSFHGEIYKLLPWHKYIAIAAPRGHAKTTVCHVIYPIWYAFFKGTGGVGIYSASEDFVLREITGVIKREFENNKRLIEFFGPQKTSKWTESFFVLKNGISFEGGGITGQLRGGRKGLIGLDDLESNETVESEDQRGKLRDRVLKELMPKLLPDGQMVYSGTLIHQLCYLKSILDEPNNGWEKRIYDCYRDGVEGEGHELWPSMYPHRLLQERKTKMGSFAFGSEYRNKPIASERAPIKEHQIRYWEVLPSQYNSVIAVDPAYSEDEHADYKVASLVVNDTFGNRYLASYVRTHGSIGEFQDAIINMWLQNRGTCLAVGIPNSGVEKGFFQSFMKRCEDRKVYPPVVELKNVFTQSGTSVSVRNKLARIVAALQPLFESGKYYIHKNHIEAKDELLTVGQALHDDLVDTMAYAENLIQTHWVPPEEEKVDRYGTPVDEPKFVTSYGY